MTHDERLRLVAPCGIDCGNCPLCMCKDDPPLMDRLTARGIPRERLPCEGCRNVGGDCPVLGEKCETYACVSRKNVDFCFRCSEFPCLKLFPSSDRAGVLPHNVKLFNLCTIERIGAEGFVKLSGDFEKLYFKGKMHVGKGPELTS